MEICPFPYLQNQDLMANFVTKWKEWIACAGEYHIIIVIIIAIKIKLNAHIIGFMVSKTDRGGEICCSMYIACCSFDQGFLRHNENEQGKKVRT